jgi:hypothetical protein
MSVVLSESRGNGLGCKDVIALALSLRRPMQAKMARY